MMKRIKTNEKTIQVVHSHNPIHNQDFESFATTYSYDGKGFTFEVLKSKNSDYADVYFIRKGAGIMSRTERAETGYRRLGEAMDELTKSLPTHDDAEF